MIRDQVPRTLRRLVHGVVAVLLSATAMAQEPATTGGPNDSTEAPILQEVVVTGSRILQPNSTSSSPIQVITSKDIQVGGRNDISDIMNTLPQVLNNAFSDFNNRTSGLTTAGGITNADLRGLGPQRTLVLVNGRRLGAGDPNTANPNPAPDLDQIPTQLIERVDVVTGGASATYGSDAIAGVINFVMKRNFEGVQIDGQYGENWHHQHSDAADAFLAAAGQATPTGSIWDGRNRQMSILLGSNIADGKGNVTGYFGYLESDPVPSGNRDFGACQLNSTTDDAGDPTGARCFGSSNSNYFRTGNSASAYSVLGNDFVSRNTPGIFPPKAFNSQPYIYTGRDDLRYTGGFLAHIDLNNHVKPYTEFSFMNDRTDQEVAPSALFRGSNTVDPTGNGNYNVNCDNPFLSGQQAGILCSPAQLAYVAANPGQPCVFTAPQADGTFSPNCANVDIGRRNVEGGGREAYFEHTNYRGVVGVKGDIADGWTYDGYGSYYYTQFYNANRNFLNFQSIANALQVTGTAANPVCISAAANPNCVPYNIFKDGGVTKQQIDYLYLTGTSYGTNSQRIAHIDVTGDLGTYGIRSPAANDGISVNVGYEHRAERIAYDPDAAESSGLLSGFGGAAGTVHAAYHLSEEFIELGGPLVQDKPGVKNLFIDLGLRQSDYSTSGKVSTGKFEVQYAPTSDVRFRASYQRAIRAPNLIELYNPKQVGQITSGDDPCTANEFSGLVAATLAQCLNTVPAAARAAFTAAYNAGTIPQGSGSQLTELLGGNAQLRPERANSFNVGATFTPEALADFTGSIDYYQIKLTDEINSVPAQIIFQQCLNTGDPFYCSRIDRNPVSFGLTGADVVHGGYIDQTLLNVGSVTLRGLDVQSHYKLTMGRWGAIGFLLNGSYNLRNATEPVAGAGTYNCSGLFGAECQTVNPRWRHVFRTTWATPFNVDISATWRFIGTVSLDNNNSNPLLFGHTFVNQVTGAPAYNYFNARIPAYNYIDLAASWDVYKGVQMRAGINNVLDKDPPLLTSEIVAGGAANTFETYDTLGRQLYIAFTAKF